MVDLAERVGQTLAGRYALERELGRGGMATVYLGRDLRHDRRVAVKILRPDLALALGPDRFLGEIAIAARLNHPHIVPLHDSGNAEGLLYYVMPYVEGEALRERLARGGALPLDEVVRLAGEVADALDYAHAQGVIHRDIKPGNILIEAGRALVTDFGLAKALDRRGASDSSSSSASLALGTPLYMSPEQIVASRQVDGRLDQYGLACVLYEALASTPPFTGATAQAIAARHLYDTAPSVLYARPNLPKALDLALSRALSKEPEQRFPSVTAFADALAMAAAPV